MVVHKSSVVKIDPSIPFEVACLVGCGVTTGYGSATRTADIRPGQDVAVVGVGGVGMSALQGAVIAGARHIFVIEPVEWKRDAALKFGATHVYPDLETAMMGIMEVTAGFMANKVIVTVGELHGADIDNYMNLTAKGGTCVATAIGSLLDTQVTLNLAMLTLMQKNLQGTIFGGGNPHHDIPLLLSMYKAGKLNLDDMITRQYKLEQINEGYQDMLEGKNIRGVIRYTRRRPVGTISMSQETVEQTPALSASQASWRCVHAKDKAGWLALMADDVVIEDPIGPAYTNPDGTGVRGKDGVSSFWEQQHWARHHHGSLAKRPSRPVRPTRSPISCSCASRSTTARRARCAGSSPIASTTSAC